MAGLLLPIFGGVAYLGPLAAMISAERLLGLKPDPIRRLGALAVAVTEDARRVATRLRLSNAEAKALDSMGHRWWRLGRHGRGDARAGGSIGLGADRYRDRLMLAWARSGDERNSARWREACHLAGALARAGVSAEGRPISWSAELPKVRRWDTFWRSRKTPGSRQIFRSMQRAIDGDRRSNRQPIHARSNGCEQRFRLRGHGNAAGYGHFTSGGIDDRIESTLPPVFRPKMVPRS